MNPSLLRQPKWRGKRGMSYPKRGKTVLHAEFEMDRWLGALRKRFGVSKFARNVADCLGVTPDAVKKWQSGYSKPSIDVFSRAVAFFGWEFLCEIYTAPDDAARHALLHEVLRRLEGDLADVRERASSPPSTGQPSQSRDAA